MRLSGRVSIFFLPLAILLLLSLTQRVAFADSCPAGTVAITDATRADATAAKIPTSATCWDPTNKTVGVDVGEAKKYLVTLYQAPGGCSSMGLSNPKVDGIEQLNSDFAVNLAKLLKAAHSAGYNITINSAYRTQAGQQCANPGGYGGTYSTAPHVRGIAADFNYPDAAGSSKYVCDGGSTGPASYKWIVTHAKEYKIGLYNQLHSYVKGECNHVEASSGAGGSTPSNPTPNSHTATGASYSQTSSPFSQPSTSQGGCPTGYVSQNNQCYSLQGQPMNQSQQPMQYAQQPQQQTPAQTNQQSGTTGTATTPNSSSQLNTNTNSNPTNTSSLNALMQAIGATSTGTGTAIGTSTDFSLNTSPINGNIGNSITSGNVGTIGQQTNATDSLAYGQPPPSQETFQSTDLSQTPANTTNQNPGLVSTTLENLKRALLYVLDFLTRLKSGASKQQLMDIPKPVMIQPIQTGSINGGGE